MSIEGGGVLGDAVAARAAGRTGREGSCRPAWSDRHRHGAGPPDPEDPAGRGRASDLRRSGERGGGDLPRPVLGDDDRELAHGRGQGTRAPERGARPGRANRGISELRDTVSTAIVNQRTCACTRHRGRLSWAMAGVIAGGCHVTSFVTTRRRQAMTDHKVGTREEWLAARLELLEAEKALTRRSDEVARSRQELPWVQIDKDYRFETGEGTASLVDLFRGRSQVLVYHFMLGPGWDEGCPSCSAIADGFAGSISHLERHDVAFVVVSRAPLDELVAYKRRMGWDFRWVSSFGSSFNYDFHVTIEPTVAPVEYNYKDQAQLDRKSTRL